MKDYYCKKPYLEWFTYRLIIVHCIYSNIDMLNDIENTLLDNDLQACLIGDFNAHTGNVSEYIVIDNNILDVLNLQDDDKLPLNSLHILEECNIPAVRCSQDKYKIESMVIGY